MEALLSELGRVLDALTSQYQRLDAASEARQDAMRRANIEHLSACISAENAAVQEIAEIEKRRVRVVGLIAERLGSEAKTQTPASWIAERVGGAPGAALGEKARELRRIMTGVAQRNAALQRASEHLARHMEGLWRQAASVLNHARTYGRLGVIGPGPSVVSAVDLRS